MNDDRTIPDVVYVNFGWKRRCINETSESQRSNVSSNEVVKKQKIVS